MDTEFAHNKNFRKSANVWLRTAGGQLSTAARDKKSEITKYYYHLSVFCPPFKTGKVQISNKKK